MKGSSAACATLLLATLIGCGGERSFTPRPHAPAAPAAPGAPATTISDAVHSAGKAHFYFLPPMVSSPVTSGTFDAGVSPTVEICVWSGNACGATVARFTTTSGAGSEVVRLSGEAYVVNWHTADFNLDPTMTYRIRALVGDVELGYADVDVVGTAKELRNVNTSEYIPLLDDRTLPIQFRIEQGFLATIAVTPATTSVRLDETAPLTAIAYDLHGQPLTATLGWSSDGATASVDQSGVVTGAALGTATISATAAGVTGSASVSVTPGAPKVASAAAGENQAAMVGTSVSVAPALVVKDAHGDLVPGVAVTFAVASGGGSVTGATTTTDASGMATVGAWVLGNSAGAQTLSGTVAGDGISGNPVTFTATGVAGAPAKVAVSAGDGQSAAAGTTVGTRPAVVVTDASGNPTPGTQVTFAVAVGSGSITGATATTDAAGIATVGSWTLGGAQGAQRLTATASGDGIAGNPVTFTATASAGAPASIAVVGGNNQSAPVGSSVSTSLIVRVVDAYGNPTPGVTVTFGVGSGGGVVTGANPRTTDGSGMASLIGWQLGTIAGQQTLNATVTSPGGFTGAPAVFTATAIAGAPAAVVKVAGDNQSAPANSPVAIAPAVVVTDSYGNPKAGVGVTFAVTGGGGSVGGGSATTNASGIAAVASWTLGAAGAQYLTVNVNVGGVSGNPTLFTATATCTTDCWQALAPMSVARYIAGAAAVDGKMYVVGGYNGATTFSLNEQYDPSTNTWATRAPMPTARFGPAAAALNGRVYAAGGYGGGYRNTVESYDPTTNTWATHAPMINTRYGAGAAAVNGLLYVFGGINQFEQFQTSMEVYDPATNTWSARASMSTPRWYPGVAVIGGKIYAFGGQSAYSTPVASAEVYDPATNSWAAVASLPTANAQPGVAEASGKALVIGGQVPGVIMNAVRTFDPATSSWATRTSMPVAQYGAGVVNINGQVYVAGGVGATYLNSLYRYTP